MTREHWKRWEKSTLEVKQVHVKAWDNRKCMPYVYQLLDTKRGDKISKIEFESYGKEDRALVYVSIPDRKSDTCYLLFRERINKVVFEQ